MGAKGSDGDFKNYPHYSTMCQNGCGRPLMFTSQQVNLLSAQAEYVVKQSQELLESVLEHSHFVAAATTTPPVDSSEFSSGSSANFTSLASLNSLLSGSLGDNSGSSGSSGGDWNKEYGSSGFDLPIWAWLLLLCCCCCCLCAVGGGAAMGGKKKSTSSKRASDPVLMQTSDELTLDTEPLMVSSVVTPSYSMIVAPATTSYAA